MSRRKKGDDLNGWLIVDKQRDMGSTDVVSISRRLFNANKNGHAGTLDPFATGVLPVAFGEATKLLPYITDGSKEYEFTLQWGEMTNTGDSEGEVVETSDVIPSLEQILSIIPQYLGKIEQTPPIYSAIKINGQRAYDLARQGIEVEIPKRIVEIHSLELLEQIEGNCAKFRVGCSKGTYVRTLGKNIAESLGTVGYLKELRRTKCACFDLSSTILLENLKNISYKKELLEVLLPIRASLRDIADLAVTGADAVKLLQGQGVSPRNYDVSDIIGREATASFEGDLVAIVEVGEKRISPLRVFNILDKGKIDVDFK